MRIFFTFIMLISVRISFAQDFLVPHIPNKGSTKENFLPKDWKIIEEQYGDLNKDKVDDLVMVIQNSDTNYIIHNNEGLGEDSIDSNPRILLVFFKDIISNSYKLVAQSNEFILRYEDPTMTDPFTGVEIEKGILKINFHIWYNAGSWYDSSISYKFRYQEKEFKLIGAESSSFHRASGESVRYSYNFLTKKYSKTTSNVFDEKSIAIENWYKIEMKGLKTIKTFNKPFILEIDGVVL